jgi:hypothetical protein
LGMSVQYEKRSLLDSYLKVPKREIFVTKLFSVFTLSDPIWIGDLRTAPKKSICVKC